MYGEVFGRRKPFSSHESLSIEDFIFNWYSWEYKILVSIRRLIIYPYSLNIETIRSSKKMDDSGSWNEEEYQLSCSVGIQKVMNRRRSMVQPRICPAQQLTEEELGHSKYYHRTRSEKPHYGYDPRS